MGKRSNFPRRPRDAYDTPLEAVLPLLAHLPQQPFTFAEPCAGAGALIDHITMHSAGVCCLASDIEPRRDHIRKADGLSWPFTGCDLIITNPPWSRPIMHEMISQWSSLRPTWLLLDADWMHTLQAAPYLSYCRRIVSVGRVKWIPNSSYKSKDNCCWYLFARGGWTATTFHGRPT